MIASGSGLAAAVTGGCAGIGRAYVEALLGRGYALSVFDVADPATVSLELKQKFPDAAFQFYRCDVGDAENFRKNYSAALLRQATDHFDVFVCNAGIMRGLFVDMEKQIQVNLMGTIRGVEMVIHSSTAALTRPSTRPQVIVCTASTNGIVPADSDMAPIYVASKFAIVGFVRSLKFLATRYNVRVNAVCPVTVETPMTSALLSPEVLQYLNEEQRGGVLQPEDCADALLRLIDDPLISGEIVTVHPNAGKGGRVEPLDPTRRYDYLGLWREDDSPKTKEWVDVGFDAIRAGTAPAFDERV